MKNRLFFLLALTQFANAAPSVLHLKGICAVRCQEVTASIATFNEKGLCQTRISYPCSPYRCDDTIKTCKSECLSDRDCATGYVCDGTTGACGLRKVVYR